MNEFKRRCHPRSNLLENANGDLADSHNILNEWNAYLSQLSYIHEVNGCETWSLTLCEEYGMKVFQNRLLSRIFGPKRDYVT
jgi:hypothetical protein